MKHYFITRWTFFFECWCNGLLKCVPFIDIQNILFGDRYTLKSNFDQWDKLQQKKMSKYFRLIYIKHFFFNKTTRILDKVRIVVQCMYITGGQSTRARTRLETFAEATLPSFRHSVRVRCGKVCESLFPLYWLQECPRNRDPEGIKDSERNLAANMRRLRNYNADLSRYWTSMRLVRALVDAEVLCTTWNSYSLGHFETFKGTYMYYSKCVLSIIW